MSFKTGLYGNDDFHNGMLDTLHSAHQIDGFVSNFTNMVCNDAIRIRSFFLVPVLECRDMLLLRN